jgi:hypothetical protein
MREDGRPVRRRREKMHPVFVELYLSPDDDQADNQRKDRKRRSVLSKRLVRRVQCD